MATDAEAAILRQALGELSEQIDAIQEREEQAYRELEQAEERGDLEAVRGIRDELEEIEKERKALEGMLPARECRLREAEKKERRARLEAYRQRTKKRVGGNRGEMGTRLEKALAAIEEGVEHLEFVAEKFPETRLLAAEHRVLVALAGLDAPPVEVPSLEEFEDGELAELFGRFRRAMGSFRENYTRIRRTEHNFARLRDGSSGRHALVSARSAIGHLSPETRDLLRPELEARLKELAGELEGVEPWLTTV